MHGRAQGREKGWAGRTTAMSAMVYCRDRGPLVPVATFTRLTGIVTATSLLNLREWGGVQSGIFALGAG